MDAPLDFSKYELDALGADVRSIVDVPGAVAQAAKWAIGIPILVAIVTSIAFSSRMETWARVPFTFVAFMLAIVGSIVIGAYAVTRKRLDTVAEATDRVVGVLGDMHTDVVQLREGHAQTSVQQVAIGLFEDAIFPMVFGAAATASGPLSFLSNRALKVPMSLVEKSVIRGIKALPDHEIGQLVDDTSAALPQINQTLSAVNDQYTKVHTNVESIVERVSKTALGSIVGLAVVAMIPLAIWLLIGVIAT